MVEQQLGDKKLIKIINTIIQIATGDEMKTLRIINETQYRKALTDKYEDFSIDYPGLFNTLIDKPNKFDMKKFFYMLSMRKQINSGKITHETASTKIGQEYYDEYVKPMVDTMD